MPFGEAWEAGFSKFLTLNKNAQEVPLPIKYKINRHLQKGHISYAPNIAFNALATWLTFTLVFSSSFSMRFASSPLIDIPLVSMFYE